jgi:hypothetical protein
MAAWRRAASVAPPRWHEKSSLNLPCLGADVGHHSAGKVFLGGKSRACFCTKREWASKRKPVAMHVLDPDASLFEDGWVTAPKKKI